MSDTGLLGRCMHKAQMAFNADLARAVLTLARLLLVLIVLLSACTNRTHVRRGIYLEAKMPLLSYASRLLSSNSSSHMALDFPTLEVYDSSGMLTYRGEDEQANVALLQRLSNGIATQMPHPTGTTLADALDRVPDFHRQKQSIVEQGCYVAITIGLSDCDGCVAQNAAISKLHARSGSRCVSILKLELER